MSSSATRNYIAVDLGKESCSIVLGTLRDGVMETETLHMFPAGRINMAGRSYWNIYSIFDEVIAGLSKAGARKLRVESIAVDSWTSDFVCAAKDGSFIGLPRADGAAYARGAKDKFLKKMSPREYYDASGIQISPGNTAFQLFAQHKEKGVPLDNARSILFISDAVGYMLTGKKACDLTQLSAAGLLNSAKKKPLKAILSVCGVKSKRFGSVTTSGTKIGHLSDEIASTTGLGKVNVVIAAGSSKASAVAALPVSDSPSAFLMMGLDGFMGIEVAEPMINDRTFELNLSNERTASGKVMIYKASAGMRILDLCLDFWRSQGKEYDAEYVQAAVTETAVSAALLDFDDPLLASQQDMPAAIVRFCEQKGMASPSGDEAVIRLIYDSLAVCYGDIFRMLQGISADKLRSIVMVGPCAADRALCNLVACECSVPVHAGPVEASALGNLMIQAGPGFSGKPSEMQVFKPVV